MNNTSKFISYNLFAAVYADFSSKKRAIVGLWKWEGHQFNHTATFNVEGSYIRDIISVPHHPNRLVIVQNDNRSSGDCITVLDWEEKKLLGSIQIPPCNESVLLKKRVLQQNMNLSIL